ncbi:hypothetical protein P168DRAFT_291910 [Aspergillus campestris IBT 28561]|uniref:Chromatin modification-related protein n=1 Tax=Aspergillus campestris (strain IBT 28561) TaxID=1392248 RepID=A0A2I1CYT0_ASPC2|nr:uncharacterized protein P168DRAFT_291910 [Aspergillus campestris IBT 28561]PKY02789.1 hypothetical protein P168DRAFT_291910 [Aspergillus campestris IBT 28561]
MSALTTHAAIPPSTTSTTTAPSTTTTANNNNKSRQTRTNPSRTSKTQTRTSFAYGRHADNASPPETSSAPHGFYPALTHFSDAVTALPREFRRHHSLLKEVDAKAWALEENLVRLLTESVSGSGAVSGGSLERAPIIGGVVREEFLNTNNPPEPEESKNRRLLFDRVRTTLSDLMMTADEKNHVVSNANDELDRQLLRLDTIYPYIAGEISEEARMGSVTHWAYSNRNTAKPPANERPRREAASNKDLAHALHEAEAASRSEARREAVLARRQRRTHVDSDMDDTRGRKGQGSKSRAGEAGHGAQTKRRKVERPAPVDGAAMERTTSGTGASGRGVSKDGAEVKKRARAPNSTAARKRNNTGVSVADTPVLAPSPLVGAAVPRTQSPGVARPQSSRAQQGAATNGRRPASSASNRTTSHNKTEPKPPKETPKMEIAPTQPDPHRKEDPPETSKNPMPISTKREDESKPAESIEPRDTPVPTTSHPAPKGRSSKTSTPVTTFSDAHQQQLQHQQQQHHLQLQMQHQQHTHQQHQQRVRPTRNTDPAPAKRSHKKNGSIPAAVVARAPSEEEESSLHEGEGDDEDDDGEPRYCYCNEISFGEMVACDNDACPREWFHLSCVGLSKPPGKNVKWYCNECKDSMRRSRSGR